MTIEKSNHFGITIFLVSTKKFLRNPTPIIIKTNKPNKFMSMV